MSSVPSPASDAADGTHTAAGLTHGLPAVKTDYGEEAPRDENENVLPADGRQQLPVVGLGGSAGGIPALKAFFEALPPKTGMAYVVVLHLSPEHESTLPALLQSTTSLPVKAAEDGERLQPDHVYIIPPRKHLRVTDDHLQLPPLEPELGKRVAVDLFFRSLADTHGARATAVVLSGADGDGAIGIKRIKEHGGLTVAQEPGEAEDESMPRSAIRTGMVDLVLRAADMPTQILGCRATESRLRLPPEDGPQPTGAAIPLQDEEANLRDVLILLRTRTGHDFTCYKRATILRRIGRRMQVNGVSTLPEYLAALHASTGESDALMQDLLISVTNFFRDKEAFATLEAQIPSLFAGKGPGDTVRVWSAACATGEEAYSLAILLREHTRTLKHPPTVQVFGCDLDEQAIHTARVGLYPAAIAADVSEERLARFFVKEHRGYRVRRDLREGVLFARHDLLKDAPYSRLDLITCRNLLIYLEPDAQTRVREVFHFALQPGGLLFLGPAERLNGEETFFATVDAKHCLYVRRPAAYTGLSASKGTGTLPHTLQAQPTDTPVLPDTSFNRPASPPLASPPPSAPVDEEAMLANLHLRLIEHFAPPSVIVDADGDIVHLSENAGRFLRPSGGRSTASLLHTIHPELRMALRTALLRAAETDAPAEVLGVPVELDGRPKRVDLRVAPAAQLAPGYVLVSFGAREREAENAAADTAVATPPETEAVVRHLERELEQSQTRLRDTIEQAGVTEEEFKSSTEELQSVNQELRSASEELETSREELQSVNEELSTVNQELKHNVAQLDHSNSDLHNLMNATAIATVFLDRELKVVRYTPPAAPLFNLIPSDTGRPLGDLKRRIDYPELETDARQVLQTLAPLEREVGEPGRRWFLARLQPYRSLEDEIAGVVLTFVDITDRRQAEHARHESEEKYRSLFRSMDEGYCIIQMLYADGEDGRAVDWRFLEVNAAFERHNGLTNATGKTIRELTPDIEGKWMAIYGRVATSGESVRFEEPSAALDGRTFDLYAFRVGHPAERKVAILFTDITARKQQELRREFLLRLSDALRPLEDAVAIQEAASRLVGEHFEAKRVGYAEARPGEEKVTIARDWCRPGVPSVVGHHRLDDYGVFIAQLLHAGRDVIVEDALSDPRLLPAEVAQWAQLGVRSGFRHPLIKAGRMVAYLFIHHERPRRWHNSEIELFHEVAERTWAAVEHARAEKALRESEVRFRGLLNASNEVVYQFNADWSEMVHLRGGGFLADTESSGTNWFSRYIPTDDQPQVRAAIQEAIRTKSVYQLEHRVVRADGTPGWVLSRATPLLDENGGIIGWFGAASDVTTRREAEEAVRHSEERLRTLADAVPQIIWANAGDGVANYFNERWYEYSGLSFEQSYSLGWQAIVHPDDAPRSVPAWNAALAAGEVFDAEYRLRGADGEYRWFIGRNVPMRDAGGQVVAWFGTATDIHDLKLAEQDAEHARAVAEAAGQAKDHFLAVLSHELRTPLMPITMALSIMAKRRDLPEVVTHAHAMIARNVELETRFINELLDITRIERGKMEITRVDMDLHDAVERAVEVSAPEIQAKGQQLTVTLEGLTCPYRGDFVRLQHVFCTLLKNASKFTPPSGAIEIRSRCQVGGWFVVEVIDTGIGLEAGAIECIFQPFEQANASIAREFGGLGLGLAIAKATVAAHGGTLHASSPGPGHGTTFTVSLPLVAAEENVTQTGR